MTARERRLREDVLYADGLLLGILANAHRVDMRGRACVAVPEDQMMHLRAVLSGEAVEAHTPPDTEQRGQ